MLVKWIPRIDLRMLGLGLLLAVLYFAPGVSDPGDGLMSQPTKSILPHSKLHRGADHQFRRWWQSPGSLSRFTAC